MPNNSRCIRMALFPFISPIVCETLNFEGMLKHKWTWSGIACLSSNSIPFVYTSSVLFRLSSSLLCRISFCGCTLKQILCGIYVPILHVIRFFILSQVLPPVPLGTFPEEEPIVTFPFSPERLNLVGSLGQSPRFN